MRVVQGAPASAPASLSLACASEIVDPSTIVVASVAPASDSAKSFVDEDEHAAKVAPHSPRARVVCNADGLVVTGKAQRCPCPDAAVKSTRLWRHDKRWFGRPQKMRTGESSLVVAPSPISPYAS